MWRYFAGAAASLLLVTGIFFIFQSRAQDQSVIPPAPQPRPAPMLSAQPAALSAPEASPKSREEKRFSRADRDNNGRIEREELLAPRRKAFAKLDTNGNGTLSFDEWGVKTLEKFGGADKDRSGWLSPAEYATTAPPPPKKKRCVC
ncbi:EF-hand domain-containing protein [Sphingomonas piscis]|uniref:EF-hand domain-containing protein n=1 Tax=Sphingomonas piscis TaxID=2714943 RepID=A0A6G7YLK4_9SPHN|nr:EF-hand domain-containing protein [Sphingomonas piscis]QIK77625.1 EF-hand domain-containing protein [Sphingomonas piscis]